MCRPTSTGCTPPSSRTASARPAALWTVRSGGVPSVPDLLTALGLAPEGGEDAEGIRDTGDGADTAAAALEPAVAEAAAGLDLLGRTGDARLAGVLATALHGARRGELLPRLAAPLGMPLARRVADLVGLHAGLHLPHPDQDRRNGLARLSLAADLGVLHTVARAVLAGRPAAETAAARDQVDWSALHAEDAGLLGEAPLAPLRAGLRDALAELDPAAADRCWAEAREAWVSGRVTAAEEAVAATWRWRAGAFPRLIHLVGPAGSGKSGFAERLAKADPTLATVSLDDLRTARGSRADQRANGDVLREGLARLDAALAAGGTVLWDATSLNQHQRSQVHAVAHRRDALTTHAVLLVDAGELVRRNADRAHPLPPDALTAQLHRFAPPYPGQAHRTWYLGSAGTVDDTDGSLNQPDGTEA